MRTTRDIHELVRRATKEYAVHIRDSNGILAQVRKDAKVITAYAAIMG